MKKRIIAAIAMFAVFFTTSYAANAYLKTITVSYDINLSIDYKTPKLVDADGIPVKPFVYEGTTYVPIRAIADNLDAEIQYYSDTKTANIVSSDAKQNLIEIDALFRMVNFLDLVDTLAWRFDREAVNDTYNSENYNNKMEALSTLKTYLTYQIKGTVDKALEWPNTSYLIIKSQYDECLNVLSTLDEMANHYKNYVQINTQYSSGALAATHQTLLTQIEDLRSANMDIIFNIEKTF